MFWATFGLEANLLVRSGNLSINRSCFYFNFCRHQFRLPSCSQARFPNQWTGSISMQRQWWLNICVMLSRWKLPLSLAFSKLFKKQSRYYQRHWLGPRQVCLVLAKNYMNLPNFQHSLCEQMRQVNKQIPLAKLNLVRGH